MTNLTMTLNVVTQEEQLLKTSIKQVSAPTPQGEITILPKHALLLTQLVTGEVKYVTEDEKPHSLVISRGFLSVSADDEVTILADSGTLTRNISIVKSEQAIRAAQETMKTSKDKRELILAEASLRRALLEIKVAQKSKKSAL